MSLRTASVFTVVGSDNEATAEKVRLGLQRQSDSDFTRNIVVCFEDGRVNPAERRMREASRFICPDTSSTCQRTLFLDEGFILEENADSTTVNDSIF